MLGHLESGGSCLRDNMQDSEFVFKVPRVRKRWQSLYCTELISELDDVWEASESRDRNSRMKSKMSVPEKSKSQLFDRQLLMTYAADGHYDTSCSNGIVEAVKCIPSKDTTVKYDFYPNTEPLVSMDEDGDDCFSVSQNKYTAALLNELSSCQSSSELIRGGSEFKNEPENTCMTSRSPSWEKGQNNKSQPWVDKVNILRQESPNTLMAECDFDSPQSPNVLIVRDESMANVNSPELDVDWASWTPPFTSSPHDNIVKDLADLSTLAHASDLLLHSGLFLPCQMEGQDMSDTSESDVDWDSLTPPAARSPRDQTVPDLDDVTTLATPSDFLLYSGPFLTCQMEDQDTSEEQDIQNVISMRPHLTYQPTEYSFPDF